MNKERRKKIEAEISQLEYVIRKIDLMEVERFKQYLEIIRDNITDICDEEQDAFDSMPEGLQYSERGQISEECIDLLNEAIDGINETISFVEFDNEEYSVSLSDIVDLLNEVIYA